MSDNEGTLDFELSAQFGGMGLHETGPPGVT